jgi:glyoxylase-like metal-dependent hydrolase (beta-lactamase superfamily II)
MTKLSAAIVQVTPFQQNCAILCDREAKIGTVIDPGGDVERILDRIRALDVTIANIVLTHGHLDHAGGAQELQDRLTEHPPILGPGLEDKFLLDSLPDQGKQFGLNTLKPLAPARFLAEGETVKLGGVAFDILHCPGHTPGHLIFVSIAHRVAIMGDVLFSGSIGRTDFPYGDTEQLLDSIHGKVLPLGDDIAFLCGHGPGSTIGTERRANPFLRSLS